MLLMLFILLLALWFPLLSVCSYRRMLLCLPLSECHFSSSSYFQKDSGPSSTFWLTTSAVNKWRNSGEYADRALMVALALELKCKIGILSPNGWWEILPTATDLADDDNFHFEEVIFLSFGKGITNSDAEPDTIHQNANHFILLKPKTGRSSELLQTLEADLVQQGYDLSHTATMSEQIALTVEGTHSSMDNVSPDEAGGRQSCNKRPASSACSDDGPQTQSSSSVSLPKRHARSDGLQGEIVCDETEPNVNGMEDSAVTDWPDEPAPGPELELPANNSGETPAATETPSAGEPPPVDLVVGTVFPYFQGDTPNTEAALQHVVDALKKGFSQWAANCGHRLHIRTAIQGRSDDKKKRKIRISCFRAGPAGPDRVSSRDDFDANLLRAKAAKTLGPCWRLLFPRRRQPTPYEICLWQMQSPSTSHMRKQRA